ncbi:hypothetical protein [Seonamhaeicola marinus]|uniref:Uncharacterized protein n=1 Tax=Seonamhaeicola marinus TaxID=1912246 RepID=A0A5D0HIB0_9FLAO|nr:hypothetical protein [Seonamhaeicola marinus]TYA70009.1 hypothetical protein FUA24_22230 [Seonamhaeicola marinus]
MNKTFFTLAFVCLFQMSFSQRKDFKEVSIDQLITETQFSSDDTDSIELIWWMPTEYWDVVFSQDDTVSASEKEAIISLLKDYVAVIAVKGKIGLFGGITYSPKDAVEDAMKVKFKDEILELVKEEDYNPDLLNFLSAIKPMLKNMLGSMGENMQILLYKDPGFKKILPVDPYGSDALHFILGDFKAKADLPLGSLLKEKVCKNCSKLLSGKWSYCPYDGTALSAAE